MANETNNETNILKDLDPRIAKSTVYRTSAVVPKTPDFQRFRRFFEYGAEQDVEVEVVVEDTDPNEYKNDALGAYVPSDERDTKYIININVGDLATCPTPIPAGNDETEAKKLADRCISLDEMLKWNTAKYN